MRVLAFLLAASAFAEVNGTVTNQTTGKLQANATVTLYKLGQAGMEALTSVKSGADGAFTIPDAVQGPHLIQTAFDGVTYNHMLPPGQPTTGLALEVFQSSKKKPAEAKVLTHMILFESTGAELSVTEGILYRNTGKVSFNDPDGGTFRFLLPEGAGKPKVQATAPRGMPIERAAEPAGTPGVYKIDFPIKPGETRIDVTYTIPVQGAAKFATKILHDGGPIRVVSPVGMTVKAEGLKLLGQEPSTQASVYELEKRELTAEVSGAGQLQSADAAGGGGEEEGGEGLKQIRPRVYDRFYAILGLSAIILALGFALLYRKREPAG